MIIAPQKLKPDNGNTAIYSSFNGVISEAETLQFAFPDAESGWLSFDIKLDEGTELHIPIFIDAYENLEKILFVESTDTLLAYNPAHHTYGIPSYYKQNLGDSLSTIIPHKTPITYKQETFENSKNISCADHLLNADMIHKKNLVDMEISFSSVSDEYLDNPQFIKNTEVLIFGAHNEYWTKSKAENVAKFIDAGGRVLILGGNTAWRRIIRHNDATWVHGHGLLKKNTFKSLIQNILGAYYTSDGYDTYAKLKVVNKQALSDIFNLEITDGEKLGKGTKFDHCKHKILGVSGYETDKLLESANGFIVLAKGMNYKGGADVVYKEFGSKGSVLNFGSVSLWHNNDERIFHIIKAFLSN